MAREFSGLFQQDGDWWVGWTEELAGAFGQGHTLDEARESLKGAIVLMLETLHESSDTELASQTMVREASAR